MKVYLVTSGSYSDYGVNAAFSTKELAEEFIVNRRNCDIYNIEEYELDKQSELEKEHVRGPQYRADIELCSGELLCLRQEETNWYRHPKFCELYCEWYNARPLGLKLSVLSPISVEHAKKIAIEKYQEFLRTDKVEGVWTPTKELLQKGRDRK